MSLWLWPTVAAAAAFGIGALLSSTTAGNQSLKDVFVGGPTAARAVLAALVGGLVTALSVIFSLTITGLQLVHQQYSPRLLRNFMRDRGTKITLGVFAGTVAYILAVLRALPGSSSSNPAPKLAVALGMVLFLACVGVVAYFAQHITNSIRVHKAMQRVVSECRQTIDLEAKTLPARSESGSNAESAGTLTGVPDPGPENMVIPVKRSGYLQEIDIDQVAELAQRYGVGIGFDSMIGNQVIAGTPQAWVWPRQNSGLSDETPEIQRRVNEHVEIGNDRSMDTDVAYGLRQLVDVAVRAMSPSLNDPYTAVQAIDHLTMLLCHLARKGARDGIRRDSQGEILVSVPVLDLAGYVRLASDQPCRYGGHEPAVAMRLLKMLEEVATLAPARVKSALRNEVERVLSHAKRHMSETDDFSAIQEQAEAAQNSIAGQPIPPTPSVFRL